MLTDDQRNALIEGYYFGHEAIRKVLDDAHRLGMLRAAEICETEFPRYYGGNMANFRQCAVAIRAEAGETSEAKPPRS